MIKNLVSYNDAVILKELKFFDRCTHYYDNGRLKLHTIIEDGWDFNQSFKECCNAFTYDQIFDMVSKKYIFAEFHIEANISIEDKSKEEYLETLYSFSITKFNKNKEKQIVLSNVIKAENMYLSKLEAKKECLKSLIKLLKNEI